MSDVSRSPKKFPLPSLWGRGSYKTEFVDAGGIHELGFEGVLNKLQWGTNWFNVTGKLMYKSAEVARRFEVIHSNLQDVTASRSSGVAYENTTGALLFVAIFGKLNNNACEISPDGVTWFVAGGTGGSGINASAFPVPNGFFYRFTGVPNNVTEWQA